MFVVIILINNQKYMRITLIMVFTKIKFSGLNRNMICRGFPCRIRSFIKCLIRMKAVCSPPNKDYLLFNGPNVSRLLHVLTLLWL